jgi:hypothetical protein
VSERVRKKEERFINRKKKRGKIDEITISLYMFYARLCVSLVFFSYVSNDPSAFRIPQIIWKYKKENLHWTRFVLKKKKGFTLSGTPRCLKVDQL